MGYIETELKYSYNDVSIVPSPISTLKHRAEANPFKNGMLPIFTAPMTSVVNADNITMYEDNKIIPILPRNIMYDAFTRFEFACQGRWAAFSFDEFEEIFCKNKTKTKIEDKAFVLIDMANGHMVNLFERVREAKSHYGDKLVVMIGNIANPETYYHATKCGADYVRLNIGGGDGCFVDGTKITTKNGGKKNIEDINVGEEVMTHDGSFHCVLNKLRYKSNETKICINKEITCTKNHKFFVINKTDIDKVNDDNINEYCFWVEAEKLDKDKHYLIKRVEEE